MRILHRVIMTILYSFTLLALTAVAIKGWPYYSLSLEDRSHHEMYELWKPGGLVGHGLGVIGSLLLILLLGYLLRKRWRSMQNWGNIRYWLNYHIWMGITGPLIILYHTSMKFGGIVAVSFWSMAAVALSGVLGRYLYLQIPRTRTGVEIGFQELEEQQQRQWIELQSLSGVDTNTIEQIRTHINRDDAYLQNRRWSALPALFYKDIKRPLHRIALRRQLKQLTGLDKKQLKPVIELTDQQEKLARRISFLDAAQSMLHHWHVVHRPFAAVMFLIMLVHVSVALLFGYSWLL